MKLLWITVYMSLWIYVFISFRQILRSGIGGRHFLTLWETFRLISKIIIPFILPPAMCEYSSYSIPFQHLMLLVFNFSLSNGCIREGNGTPLQYSCLENPMDGGAWWAAVNGVAKSRTRLSDFTFTFHFHTLEKEMATHSSVLAWRIPGMGEPGGLPSLVLHRVGHDWSDLEAAAKVLELNIWYK